MTRPALRIAIVGGGPGGLTLASILHHTSHLPSSPLRAASISITVFEMDASSTSRQSQGGMLDIHRASGQRALERAGLLDVFKTHMRVDATEFLLRGKDGKVWLRHTEEPDGKGDDSEGQPEPERPEIDRIVLRSILLDSLPPDMIQWGKKLVSLTTTSDPSTASSTTKFKLGFSDGTSAGDFDIIVGADGTWSKVRHLTDTTLRGSNKVDNKPPFSGVICVEGCIQNLSVRYPELAEFAGKGSCHSIGEKLMLASQLNGDGSLRTYVMFEGPEDWNFPRPRDADVKTKVRKFVDEYIPLAEWNVAARNVILLTDIDPVVRPLYGYPPGHRWTSPVNGIVLLGDAAHVMTPFAGVGVNLALHDALDLASAIEGIAERITEEPADNQGVVSKAIEECLAKYESAMFERASQNADKTIKNRGLFLGEGGVQPVSEAMGAILSVDPEGNRID
ncbi:monooxygenase [Coprinopsis cinerea okayama7|uniref:Monooxygenase n=1 Tax=Coprinopsis cinerea (strain Okayama-7 / 130 / ATCC MYA-4618 / FGSC 9003) TaxID=240176 RepID=A8N4I4_COPC7|nr:monooxygenase [Coprinopsis cinerea okayama7\|eukprot:XP_001829753.1 monooxygenase [Coprinopsis cinerea okayama7\